MQTLVESRIDTVPMAMSPWPWPRPFSHMRGAWGLGTSLVLGSSLALFSCLSRGRGEGLANPVPDTKAACSGNKIGNVQIGNLEIRNV